MIGEECPECNTPLGKAKKCRVCGWKPEAVDDGKRRCAHCQGRRPFEFARSPLTYPCPHCQAISVWFCQDCGIRGVGTPTIECDDKVRRCHPCYDAKYIAPYVSRPEDACPDCDQLAGDHMTYVRAFLETWQKTNRGKRWALVPGLLERLGHQPMRSFETRPAAAWTNEERVLRASEALESYRLHLANLGGHAVSPIGAQAKGQG